MLGVPSEVHFWVGVVLFLVSLMVAFIAHQDDFEDVTVRWWIVAAFIGAPLWPLLLLLAIFGIPVALAWWGICFLFKRTFPLMRPLGSKPYLEIWRETQDRKHPCEKRSYYKGTEPTCKFYRNHQGDHSWEPYRNKDRDEERMFREPERKRV